MYKYKERGRALVTYLITERERAYIVASKASSITGCLSYLVNMPRPDLSFAYSQLSKFEQYPAVDLCKLPSFPGDGLDKEVLPSVAAKQSLQLQFKFIAAGQEVVYFRVLLKRICYSPKNPTTKSE